jgi:hypothetical protein
MWSPDFTPFAIWGCAGLCNRAELLLTGLEPPYVSLTSSGRRQVDASRCKYPVSVEAWQDFGKSVLVHRDGLASTQRWFPEAFPDAAKVSQGTLPLPQWCSVSCLVLQWASCW